MVSFWHVFFVDLFWYVWHRDIRSVLNKLAEEEFMVIMSGDVVGGCPFHSQWQLCKLWQTALTCTSAQLGSLCCMDHVQDC